MVFAGCGCYKVTIKNSILVGKDTSITVLKSYQAVDNMFY